MSFEATYAMKDGVMTHVSEVKSGLECGCVCPGCGEVMVARKGDVRKYHFAHYGISNAATRCTHNGETELHLLAKEALVKSKTIMLPPLMYELSARGRKVYQVELHPERRITFDEVLSEKRHGDIIPDIIGIKKGTPLFIEIVVSNPISEKKENYIYEQKISAIQIDARSLVADIGQDYTLSALENLISRSPKHREWVYNKKKYQLKREYQKSVYPDESMEWIEAEIEMNAYKVWLANK